MNAPGPLLDILEGRKIDRVAVVCPGGMMSLAVTDVMDSEGVAWPEAHSDPEAMVRLALAMQEATQTDNIAMPFCMTVEAEAYGTPVDLGNRTVQPRPTEFILPPDGSGEISTPDFHSGRAGVLLRALRQAKKKAPHKTLVGNIVGPFSLLSMLCDPLMVLRRTRRNPTAVLDRIRQITRDLTGFVALQRQAGADIICISEPTATGEILGGRLFRTFVLPFIEQLIRAIRTSGARAIVHICGDIKTIETELLELSADAVSFDSMVDIVSLARESPPWRVMGNVDAFLLEAGPVEKVTLSCRRLLEGGVLLLAPACGVIPSTPLEHLKAMRAATDEYANRDQST